MTKTAKKTKKCAIIFTVHRHNVNALMSNSIFWIFAVLVV